VAEFIDIVILRNPEDNSVADMWFEDDHGKRIAIPQVFDEPYWDRHRIQHDTIDKL